MKYVVLYQYNEYVVLLEKRESYQYNGNCLCHHRTPYNSPLSVRPMKLLVYVVCICTMHFSMLYNLSYFSA